MFTASCLLAFSMRFAYPVYLHILWLIPLFLLLFFWAANARRRSLERFGEDHLVTKLSRTVSRRRQKMRSRSRSRPRNAMSTS